MSFPNQSDLRRTVRRLAGPSRSEGYAPPCQGRPPKDYREIFQVLREIIPEPD